MRSLHRLALAILAAWIVHTAYALSEPSQGPNLLDKGGFERVSDGKPAGWQGDGLSSETDKHNVCSGKCALRVRTARVGGHFRADATTEHAVPLDPKKLYLASVWAKGSGRPDGWLSSRMDAATIGGVEVEDVGFGLGADGSRALVSSCAVPPEKRRDAFNLETWWDWSEQPPPAATWVVPVRSAQFPLQAGRTVSTGGLLLGLAVAAEAALLDAPSAREVARVLLKPTCAFRSSTGPAPKGDRPFLAQRENPQQRPVARERLTTRPMREKSE